MSEFTPNTQIGDFTLTRYLGAGQFGEVWQAYDRVQNIDVAIKFYVSLDQKGRTEFFKEYELANSLKHNNLMPVFQLGEHEHRPYLVMEYCARGASSSLVGALTPANENMIWQFAIEVAAGLKCLHDNEIVHMDIKPENIMIANNGRFVIADFGISTNVRATMRKQSGRNNNAGAVAYMAPEKFKAEALIIKAGDIWALGVSIYELATGRLPFSGQGGVMQKNGAEMPEIRSKGYSNELNFLMQKCLALNPWDRFQAKDINWELKNGLPPDPSKSDTKDTITIRINDDVAPTPDNNKPDSNISNLSGTISEHNIHDEETTSSSKPTNKLKIILLVCLTVVALSTAVFFLFYKNPGLIRAEQKLQRYYQLVDDCRNLTVNSAEDKKTENLLKAKIILGDIKSMEKSFSKYLPDEYNKSSDFDFLSALLKNESIKCAQRAKNQKDKYMMKSYLLMSKEFYANDEISRALDMVEDKNFSVTDIKKVIDSGITQLQ